MHTSLGLLFLTVLASAGLGAATGCAGITGSVASALQAYPPAQTYCSSKYPLPKKTITSTASVSTTTSTVATTTLTSTVATDTVTVTDKAVTKTITSFSTPTISKTATETKTETDTETQTVTVTANNKRRRDRLAARATDSRSSQFNSFKTQAASFVAAVCTCLETPASTTVTTTPITTAKATATSTVKITNTETSTVTPTSTVTEGATADPITVTVSTATETETITTTTTTTTTVPSPTPACVGSGSSTCSDGSTCDDKVECVASPSKDDCYLNKCTGDCIAASYDDKNKQCTIFHDCCPEDQSKKKRSAARVPSDASFLNEREIETYIMPGANVTIT